MTLITSISGIRGTLGGQPGTSLTPPDITRFASAYGAWLLETGAKPLVVIGRDARPSGPLVAQIVSATLRMMGISVIDLGLSTTPTVEMAVPAEQAGGGIIITASHNPANWNALKLLNARGEFISAAEGERVLALATSGATSPSLPTTASPATNGQEAAPGPSTAITYVENARLGSYREDRTHLQRHIEAILKLPFVDTEAIAARNFRVIVDAVNSSGGIAVPMLLEALGVSHVKRLFCEPTGQFPHNPEPLPENLTAIAAEITKGKYDLGIVVDPDVDRLVFVCEDGSMFGEEYTLVAVADYILSRKGGGNTVSNLSSTRALQDVTERYGGTYQAAAVGEVNVVERMKATEAVIGGEGNGGIIYPELHYGRDALVGIALFLSHLAAWGKPVSHLRRSYPGYHISKNKIELEAGTDVGAILERVRERYARQPANLEDGVRLEFDKQWVHLRRSNTEPIIRIYAEADSATTADALAGKIVADIREILAPERRGAGRL